MRPGQAQHRYYGREGRFVAALVLAFGIIFCICLRKETGLSLFGALFAAVGAFVLLVQRTTVADFSARAVYLHFRLFDRLTLWTRAWSFQEFDAVVRSRVECTSSEGGGRTADMWAIGLRRRSGRVVWIRYENVEPDTRSTELNGVAQELAAQMGLPIREVEG